MTREARIKKAIRLVVRFGGIGGEHHKAWVMDQVVRALTTPRGYERIVREARDGEDGPDSYSWDEGIAP